MTKQPELSIIVPAYNEEKTIEKTLAELEQEIKQWPIKTEILVVCDGSRDNTVEIAKTRENDTISVLSYTPNKGKGEAIQYGIQRANGAYIATFDAGLDFPPSDLATFYHLANTTGVDGVIGSKRHKKSSITYPLHRKILSKAGQLVTKALFHLPYSDTQVGIKLFKNTALKSIVPLMQIKRYAFDIELLVIADMKHYRIIEAPVTLHYNPQSSNVNTVTIIKTLKDVLRIFFFKHTGKYSTNTITGNSKS